MDDITDRMLRDKAMDYALRQPHSLEQRTHKKTLEVAEAFLAFLKGDGTTTISGDNEIDIIRP